MLFSSSCKDNQTIKQSLTAPTKREKLMLTVVNNNSLANEMVKKIMSNDNYKILLQSYIVKDTAMVSNLLELIANDPSMSKMMMVKSIEMCDGNILKCNLLRGTLQMYPSTQLYKDKE